MSETIKRIVALLRRELEQEYGERLRKIILFGSQANGLAERDSDIDVAIILSGAVDVHQELSRTEQMVARLSLDGDCVVSLFFLSEERYHNGDTLLDAALRDGIAA